MKILGIGGGSMGRRRLRDLTYLNDGNMLLFEPQPERCREVAAAFGVQGFTRLEEALAEQPDAITISTPPALHEPYVRQALVAGLHVFAEVPFVLQLETLEEVAAQAVHHPGVLGISHTIRYYPPFRLIHDLVREGRIGQPLYVEYSLGQYLPGWHPYEDYRTFYGSDFGLGGAGMDMLYHELSAIQWWLGPVVSVYARFSKVSPLQIKGPDSQDLLLTFANGCKGFFHNDVVEQGSVGRHVRIAGDEGSLEWHQNEATLRLYAGQGDRTSRVGFTEVADWEEARQASAEMGRILAELRVRSGQILSAQSGEFTYESCYLREMRHFLGAARGEHPFTATNIDQELHTVRTVDAAVRSSQSHHELAVTGAWRDA